MKEQWPGTTYHLEWTVGKWQNCCQGLVSGKFWNLNSCTCCAKFSLIRMFIAIFPQFFRVDQNMQQQGFICWVDWLLKLVKVEDPIFRANFSWPCMKNKRLCLAAMSSRLGFFVSLKILPSFLALRLNKSGLPCLMPAHKVPLSPGPQQMPIKGTANSLQWPIHKFHS